MSRESVSRGSVAGDARRPTLQGRKLTAVERLQQARGIVPGAERVESADQFPAFNPDSEEMGSVPAEEVFMSMKETVVTYGQELQTIQETLDEALTEVWDVTRDPIGLDFQPKEFVELSELLKTDNAVIRKLITVFAVLCEESVRLVQFAEEEFFGPLSVYGERVEDGISTAKDAPKVEEPSPAQMLSRFIGKLEEVSQWTKRAGQVVKSFVEQLASFYNESYVQYKDNFKGALFITVFRRLEELLGTCVCLDLIIQSNDNLTGPQSHWAEYKRVLTSCETEPELFQTDMETLATLQLAASGLEKDVLSGTIFRNTIAVEFEYVANQMQENSKMDAANNKEFMRVYCDVVKQRLDYLNNLLGTQDESDHPKQFIGFSASFALLASLDKRCNFVDKSLFKKLLKTQEKAIVVHVYGKAMFRLNAFLWQCCNMSDIKDEIKSATESLYQRMVQSFPLDIAAQHHHVTVWMTRMDSEVDRAADGKRLPDDQRLKSELRSRCDLIIRGTLLANQISTLVRKVLFLHIHLGQDFRLSVVRAACMGLELLKAIYATYHRRSAVIAKHYNHLLRLISQDVQQRLDITVKELQKELSSGKQGKWDGLKLDKLSELSLIVNLLQGPSTPTRRHTANLLWDMVNKKTMKDQEDMEVRFLLRKLDIAAELHRTLRECCSCTFMICFRELVPTMMGDIFKDAAGSHRLHYFLAAVRDPIGDLAKCTHENAAELQKRYEHVIIEDLEEKVVTPLCNEIEKDLRLQIHSSQIQGMDQHNPVKDGVRNWSHFTGMRAIRFGDQTVDIKHRVTHYLDTTFYNLTTVALHDWQTYSEMRKLAEEKYNLTLAESHLPTGTLEQGLDVLQVMRNIHVFVARYAYNLNTQMFVERPTDNKYLKSIGIQQIANSIRTHGTGMMNTTVNFTYQFLSKKFRVFSTFMFDDYIRSRLLKDQKFYKENRDQLGNKYPWERAEKFNQEIKKLHGFDDGSSLMDKFRELITEIGNALGFVRMIRAGGLNYCSAAVGLVPNLQKIPSFVDQTKDEQGLSADTKQAAENLDEVIADLVKKFAEVKIFFASSMILSCLLMRCY